jgi:hypothetical protein
MDLDTYAWKNRITIKKIAEDTGLCPLTLGHIRALKRMPRMDTAMKLSAYTNGDVSLVEMMPTSDLKKLETWLKDNDKKLQTKV